MLASKYQNLRPSPMLKIFQAAAKLDDVINLGIGEPDFDTPKDIIEAGCKAAKEGFTHYPPVTGFSDLKEEIARYWAKKYDLSVEPDEIMVTTGGIQASYLALQAICEENTEVLIPEICFTPYFQQLEFVGAKVIPVPIEEKDQFRLTPQNLQRALTPNSRILILNSPSNPTGAVSTYEDLEGIAKIVRERDLIVISDEIYEAFVFEGRHIPFSSLPGMKERTITIAGFSKTYAMTGWRIGYAIAPAHVIRVMGVISVAQSMGVNTLAQKAAVFALQNKDDFVKEMVETYRRRTSVASEAFGAIPGLSCIKPKGGFYLFVNIKGTGMDSVTFCMKALENAKVAMIPGVAFGKRGDDFVRIACTVSEEKLLEAAQRLKSFLEKGQ